jgi:hypothetical protein
MLAHELETPQLGQILFPGTLAGDVAKAVRLVFSATADVYIRSWRSIAQCVASG